MLMELILGLPFENLCPAEKADPQLLPLCGPSLLTPLPPTLRHPPPSNAHRSYMINLYFHHVWNTSCIVILHAFTAGKVYFPPSSHTPSLDSLPFLFQSILMMIRYTVFVSLFYTTGLFLLFFKPFSFTVGLTVQGT